MTAYYQASDYSTLVSRVQGLGIVHLRDSIENNQATYNAAMNEMLDATNAKLDGVTECVGVESADQTPTTPSDIRAFDTAINGRLEIVEAPNEVDIDKDPNWVQDTINCLPKLRSAEPQLPLMGPSLADELVSPPKLGNISNDINYGNAHRYFAAHNPGSQGWGGLTSCGVYGAVSWAFCEARINAGTKPIMITETGYNSKSEVDELTQAKYLSRLMFVNLQSGFARSYLYELKDDDSNSGFGYDGLIRSDDSEKPAYTAIASELAFFADSPKSIGRKPLAYTLANLGSTIDHLLFEKTDGSYILAIWNEKSSWNVAAKEEAAVPKVAISMALAHAPSSVSVVSMDDTGKLDPATFSSSGNTYTIPIDDHVTFVSIR